MGSSTDLSGCDGLTPREVTTAQFEPGEPCDPCKVDNRAACFIAVCRGCGCRRPRADGWPHTRQEAGQ